LGTISLFVPAIDGVAAARLAHCEFGGGLPPVQNGFVTLADEEVPGETVGGILSIRHHDLGLKV
jgi:hypothetical protein